MKYVMFEVQMPGGMVRHVPVMFPDSLVHEDVADALAGIPGLNGNTVVSAGTCSFMPGSIDVGGESKTLELKSHPGDQITINMIDYQYGLQDGPRKGSGECRGEKPNQLTRKTRGKRAPRGGKSTSRSRKK
jgi:hypothetical protein